MKSYTKPKISTVWSFNLCIALPIKEILGNYSKGVCDMSYHINIPISVVFIKVGILYFDIDKVHQ